MTLPVACTPLERSKWYSGRQKGLYDEPKRQQSSFVRPRNRNKRRVRWEAALKTQPWCSKTAFACANSVIKSDGIRMSRPLLILMKQLQIFASRRGRKTDRNAITIVRFLGLTFWTFGSCLTSTLMELRCCLYFFHIIISIKCTISSSLKRQQSNRPEWRSGGCQIGIQCRVQSLPQWPFSELPSLTSSLICSLLCAFYVYFSSSPAVQQVVR